MKIAHFAIFSPHGAGLYHTVHDLILAERLVGIDAQFIDFAHNGEMSCREGLQDGEVITMPLDWAKEADLVISHSATPSEIIYSKPCVLALHGRPESSFNIELNGKSPIMSTILSRCKKHNYKGIVTFWPEYVFHWSKILNREISYIPSPVNFDEYTPNGKKRELTGNPRILICDMWRDDTTPFNLIFAAQYFKDHYYPNAKVYLYGIEKNPAYDFLTQMQGMFGVISGLTSHLDEIYRSVDMVITPNIISTRVIREALASNCPVVAPVGCSYTPYTAEPRDYKAFALEMKRCFEERPTNFREKIYREHNLENVGKVAKKVFDTILNTPQWNAMSITQDDWTTMEKVIKDFNVMDITEFGAGVSTELFSRLGMKVTSYETSLDQIQISKKQTPNAEYVFWNGKQTVKLNGSQLAFIDAPHGGVNREYAYKSVYESQIPIVICHDQHRPEDRQWVRKYFKNWTKIADQPKTLVALKRS